MLLLLLPAFFSSACSDSNKLVGIDGNQNGASIGINLIPVVSGPEGMQQTGLCNLRQMQYILHTNVILRRKLNESIWMFDIVQIAIIGRFHESGVILNVILDNTAGLE